MCLKISLLWFILALPFLIAKNKTKQQHSIEPMVARGEGVGGMGKMSEGEREIQASSYAMNMVRMGIKGTVQGL